MTKRKRSTENNLSDDDLNYILNSYNSSSDSENESESKYNINNENINEDNINETLGAESENDLNNYELEQFEQFEQLEEEKMQPRQLYEEDNSDNDSDTNLDTDDDYKIEEQISLEVRAINRWDPSEYYRILEPFDNNPINNTLAIPIDRMFRDSILADLRLFSEAITNNRLENFPLPQLRNRIFSLNNNVSFSASEYLQAEEYYKNNLYSGTTDVDRIYVTRPLLNSILDFWFDSGCDSWPTKEQLLNKIFSIPCACHFTHSPVTLKRVIEFWVFEQAAIPTCDIVHEIIDYETIMQRFPTIHELNNYIRQNMEFFNNPLDFFQRDKVHVPVINIHKLPLSKGDDETVCALCQETITSLQESIIVKPCNHQYHNRSDECLGESSIHNWFSEHNFCPLCKQKVVTDFEDAKIE